MNRRTFLRAAGIAAAAGIAGCLRGEPDAVGANEFGYDTTRTEGVEVPLVPIDDAIEWYRDDNDAVFADARSLTAFRKARVAGAVFSPAEDGQEEDDPVEALPEDTRVVTYCGCPHHLSTLRGASLIRDGYVHTYAIDEGFNEWTERGYPLEGENVDASPPLYTVEGETDPASAGEFAWIRHEPTGQREAAPIDDDGGFTLHVRFYEVDSESTVRLSTPAGEVTDSLGALADEAVEV